MGLNVIITGSTGMVGEGVLHVCLQHAAVEKILVVNRRSIGITHPKLTEVILTDFFDLSTIEPQLSGYDSCFFCLGISSVGAKADDYYRTTYTLTMHFAETLSRLNKGMTFCYVSGAGTDGSEQGKLSWARVKGKTENDLRQLGFRQAYGLRPGFIRPIPGLKHTHAFYSYINWLFPLGRKLYPEGFCTMEELSLAMIELATHGYTQTVISGKDIIQLAKK